METTNPGKRRRHMVRVQMLTLSRLPLGIGFAAVLLSVKRDPSLLAKESPAVLILCAAVLLLLELTDLFDGILARKRGVVTEWGAMLDPYADSISRITVYWALAYRGLAMAVVPLVMACRDVTVAYCRIVLTRTGHSVSAKWSGKIKAQFQSIGAFFLLLGPFYWEATGRWTIKAISLVVLGVTAASVVEYAAGAIAASKGVKKEAG